MIKATILASALLATWAVLAHAESQSYVVETCAYLHKAQPSSANKRIAVTCRSPRKTTYFSCPAANGTLTDTVPAEAISTRCVNPFSR